MLDFFDYDPRLRETLDFWFSVAKEEDDYNLFIQSDLSHWILMYIEDGVLEAGSYAVDGKRIYVKIRPSFASLVHLYLKEKELNENE